MGRLTEPLTGGLVTDRDPALLKPGQLQGMRNLVYRNGAAALCHARGRSQFGVVSAATTAVAGLRDIHFDNGDFYLVAMADQVPLRGCRGHRDVRGSGDDCLGDEPRGGPLPEPVLPHERGVG